jgi:hypothetical protein
MCLPEKEEQIDQKQFSDTGYSGKNDVWISAPDPSAERVYEGTAAPVAKSVRRYYLGNRFEAERKEREAAKKRQPFLGTAQWSGSLTAQNNPTRSQYDIEKERLSKPAPRKQYEIVLENGYDDPNVQNLDGDFYKTWAQKQSGTYNPKVDSGELPTVTNLVQEAAVAAEQQAKARPRSISDIYYRSTKTKDSNYKDLAQTKRDGVTNYVARA